MGVLLARHLQRLAQKCNIYINRELNEYAQATLESLEELDADKVNRTEIPGLLEDYLYDTFGIYRDEDGDLAQTDEEEEETEENE